MQIAHCMYLVLDPEHNTDNSLHSTHYYRNSTANSKHGTLNCGGKKEYFEHDKINYDCITHHYEHSKSNYEPKAAKPDSHRPNSRQQPTNFCYDS